MKSVNRLEVYLGLHTDEAIKIVDSWGNRKQYEDNSPKDHLVNNMNGWLAEECFKATWPEWEYINKDEHTCISEFNGWRKRSGEPDFETVHDNVRYTCEVKKYWNINSLKNKIDWWKKHPGELHNANYIYCLIGKIWYAIDRNDWSYHFICETKYPDWFNGWFKL